MGNKIGFEVRCENESAKERENIVNVPDTVVPRQSVVRINFPQRNLTCSYYNDKFDLKVGDLVYVDGKLEGLQGRIVEVSYTFKIRLSDYKRVIGLVHTDVKGRFYPAGSHFVTNDPSALNYERASSWFMPPADEDTEFVSGTGGESFELYDLSGMRVPADIADRGHEIYMNNGVVYFEVSGGRGRAIVIGSKPYEVEFGYESGTVTDIVCGCYCSGACKHEFAAMLQLRETLDIIKEQYPFIDDGEYFAAVCRGEFFKFAADTKSGGSITLE